MPIGTDDHFLLDVIRRRLMRNGEPLSLGDRAFDLLAALVEAQGQPVAPEILVACVWPDVVVSAGNLRVQIRALRRLLGDGAIQNVPGAGYRLAMPLPETVTSGGGATASPPVAPLLGRDGDMRRLLALLDTGRLVTIVGPGGVGKTCLALAALVAGVREGERHAHVELAALRQPGMVPLSVATALSVKLMGPDIVGAIQATLAEAPALILLDNAEHMLDEVGEFVGRLLSHCPNLRVLLTSREPLNLGGERLLHLCPLACPPATSLPPDELAAFPAMQLVLRHREAAGWPALEPTELPLLARLCRQVDGLPLALLLLAAQLREARIGEQALSLMAQLPLIPLPPADGQRYDSLSRMLDWSFDLLSPDERLLMSRLAIFSGAWELPAAIAVCGLPPLEPSAIPGMVAGLVSRSLVSGPLQTSQPGLRLLETIRQYAAARSDDCLEQGLLRLRLADWAMGGLARYHREASRAGVPLLDVTLELADVRFLLDWAFKGGPVLLGQRLAIEAHRVWNAKGLYVESARQLIRAWDARTASTPKEVEAVLGLLLYGEGVPIRLPYHADRARYVEQVLPGALDYVRGAGLSAHWRFWALSAAGWLYYYAGQYHAAKAVWEEAAALCRRHDMFSELVGVLSTIGWLVANKEEAGAARVWFHDALAIAERYGLRRSLTMMRLADAEFAAGDTQRAIDMARAALAIEEIRVPALHQTLHANLASYLLLDNKITEAVVEADAALAVTIQHHYTHGHAWTLERGALIALHLGLPATAAGYAALGDALVRASNLMRGGPERVVRDALLKQLETVAPVEPTAEDVEAALRSLRDLYASVLRPAPDVTGVG